MTAVLQGLNSDFCVTGRRRQDVDDMRLLCEQLFQRIGHKRNRKRISLVLSGRQLFVTNAHDVDMGNVFQRFEMKLADMAGADNTDVPGCR